MRRTLLFGLSLRLVKWVGISLEALGVLCLALIGLAVIGYLTALAINRWSLAAVFLGLVAIVVWSALVGAFARLYVAGRQTR